MNRAYFLSVLSLVGHLMVTGAIFLVLFTVGWLVTLGIAMLNSIHPFQPDVLSLVAILELWLVYLDSAFCFFVLVYGMTQFCRGLVKEDS